MATVLDPPLAIQHFTLDGVTWSYYEHTLEQVGDRPIRVTFLDGNIEVMSPLPEHEAAKKAVAGLVESLTVELGIPRKSFGSTTFRREDRAAGTEPDECYYFRNIDLVRGMKRFDPRTHPAPDLAIEIDILNPSIPREPIYARLGVPELWRYDGDRLIVLLLTNEGTYREVPTSGIFPFLPLAPFTTFIKRMIDEEEVHVLIEFRNWVRSLSTK
ncbi:MAG TPA: Uma2 family endonuclease [Tepidisphaeraceae bacterium]|jgi:Uma2 family endonuclease|nr:Uma2 family endonuclease [Tepidisphaeraceae bacterium]